MSKVQVNTANILTVADHLFQTQGFDETRFSDIADAANIPVEILEREHGSKQQIALAIYQRLSEESYDSALEIGSAPLSDMYYSLLAQRLTLLDEHSEVISILYANAMRPQASITAADLSPGMRDPIMDAIATIIENTSNKPTKNTEDLQLFMYAFHFLVVIFWLYDRTENKAASLMFINFLRELIKMMRPMLVLPMIAKALKNAAKILMVVFGGARLVESSGR